MKRAVARYKTKPKEAQCDVKLIEKVFQEARQVSPRGVRYRALKPQLWHVGAFRLR
jgi:hypothetical protein